MKVTKKTVFEVDYQDLERAIDEAYGIDFEMPCEEELSNDTAWITLVTPVPLANYDLKQFKSGKYQYMTRPLMDDMCAKGLIEAGEYVVQISW